MNRIVYLFELDSARKYDFKNKDTVYKTEGVHAMFHEIIDNGNIVAISMNQLTDSQFFDQILRDDYAYPIILELFKIGALRVNLFGNIRTASQYIQNAIAKCLCKNDDSFKFSNLPVQYHEKQLLTTLYHALRNSDLSELQELYETNTDPRYQRIYRYVNMILALSVNETSNIPAKKSNKTQNKPNSENKDFIWFLYKICNILKEHNFQDKEFADKVLLAIKEIEVRDALITDGRINRSNWLYNKDDSKALSPIAEEIVNLAYNYVIEYGINGISKHYSDEDFETSFKADLINRFMLYTNRADETTTAKPLPKRILRKALRFAKYKQRMNKKSDTQNCQSPALQYEKDYRKDMLRWNLRVTGMSFIYLIITALYTGLFFTMEFIMGFAENYLPTFLSNPIYSAILSIFIIGLLGSAINVLLQKILKTSIPDILECVVNFILYIIDAISIIFKRDKRRGKYESYRLY